MLRKPLIIGYGNPLRQDDGVAWRAVQLIEARLPPGLVTSYCRHQLTPELASAICSASLVILLDAAAGGGTEDVECRAVSPHRFAAFSHDIQPRQLLALAKDLFAATPPAFLFTANVTDFGFEDRLSEHAERCAVLMARRAIELLESFQLARASKRRAAHSAQSPAAPGLLTQNETVTI